MSRIAGVLLGTFSFFMLMGGAAGFVGAFYSDVIRLQGGANTFHDLFETILIVLIGAFTAFFSRRCLTAGNSNRMPPTKPEV